MKKNRSTAIIIRNEKVLLIHRHKPGRDYYTLPGGGVEFDEDFEEACIREVREETGLKVRALELVYRYITLEKEENYYLTQVTKAEPALGGQEAKHQSAENSYEFFWADAAQVESLNLVPEAARRVCLEILKK
jgi:8-oxo-dGTP diphosphatase